MSANDMWPLDINDLKYRRELNAKRSVACIFNLIQDRIADANRQSVLDDMFKMFMESGLELTDRAEREQYEAWHKLHVEIKGQ